jgi:hypothetical protein
LFGAAKGAHTAHYLARGATGEGEEQYSLRCDAALEKNADSGRQRRRLAGSGSRDDAERSVSKIGGLTLTFIEFLSGGEHIRDAIFGVLHRRRRR